MEKEFKRKMFCKNKLKFFLQNLQTFKKLSLFNVLKTYCINVCIVQSCSVSINSCKSESVKLLPEATLKVTNSQNSCTGWASACIKHEEK